ncbi:hypothetical protein [Acidicapsa ligni]|uniref:hypothetical protein n=1 Tax=Acidicapsa ligni TaxID=542300 RepID=UPI0021DFBDE2|nr:hypothetical protein [Acidicapsa ligni]
MAKNQVITESMIEAALAVIEKRIAEPPAKPMKSYSRRDAFLKLRGRAKEALAVGHSLETVLDDLKGVGIGMTLSTARQYLKPGRKAKQRGRVPAAAAELVEKPISPKSQSQQEQESQPKGTFIVTEDEREI